MDQGYKPREVLSQLFREWDLKEKYLKLKTSGVLTEVVPELTGEWDKDKDLFRRIWN